MLIEVLWYARDIKIGVAVVRELLELRVEGFLVQLETCLMAGMALGDLHGRS